MHAKGFIALLVVFSMFSLCISVFLSFNSERWGWAMMVSSAFSLSGLMGLFAYMALLCHDRKLAELEKRIRDLQESS